MCVYRNGIVLVPADAAPDGKQLNRLVLLQRRTVGIADFGFRHRRDIADPRLRKASDASQDGAASDPILLAGLLNASQEIFSRRQSDRNRPSDHTFC